MRRTILLGLGVLVALAALAYLVPMLIPADALKARIEAEADRATGRHLVIAGPMHISLIPVLGVTAGRVQLDNPAGAPGGSDFVSMDGLIAGVRFWPLLQGRIEITHVTLTRPVIHLTVDANGRANWASMTAPSAPAQSSGGGSLPASTRFDGLTITDGTLIYSDAQDGLARQLDHVNLEIGLTSLTNPAQLDGEAVYRGARIGIAVRIASLADLRDDIPTQGSLSLTAPLAEVRFDGMLARHASKGQLKLVSPDLARLIAWANRPLKAASGLGRISLDAALSVEGERQSLTDLSLTLDAMHAHGALTIDRSAPVVKLSGNLAMDRLDLNRFLPVPDAGHGAQSTAPSAAGWSPTPIDFSMLDEADADLTLSASSVLIRKLHIGATQLALRLTQGVLNATLDPLRLYGGSGSMKLTLDATRAVPTLSSTLAISGVSAKPFLSDALGISRIEGVLRLDASIVTQGRSPSALMHAIAGSGRIAFSNGRIHGVDLGHIASEIQKFVGRAGLGTSGNAGDSTVFTSMGGSFTAQNGVLTNRDFQLESPFLRMTGAGTIDLGNQTLDYVVKPRAIASLSGQGGGNAPGIGLPFRIHGPWGSLHYTPDLSGVASGVLDSVLKGGVSTKSLLHGLFGGNDSSNSNGPDQPQPAKKKKPNPLKAIESLFGH